MPLRRSSRIQNKNNFNLDNNELSSTITVIKSLQTTRGSKKSRKLPSTTGQKQSQRKSRSSSNLRSPSRSKSQPVIISLDVTDSESDCTNSDVEEIASASPPKSCRVSRHSLGRTVSGRNRSIANNRQKPLWPSVRINEGRCVLDSDSDPDDDTVIIRSPRKPQRDSLNHSGSEDDLYAVNYQEERLKTFQAVEEDLKHSTSKGSKPEKGNLPDVQITPSSKKKYTSVNNCGNSHKKGSKPSEEEDLNLNLDNIDVSSIVLRGSAGKLRRNKKTKNAIASLEAFSKRLQDVQACNDSLLDVSDDIIMADNSNLTIRVCWGTEYIRYTINRRCKFATLYQELAEKHKVSVSQVVLNFKDRVISPDDYPSDVGLTFGDIIEGGIWNKNSSPSDEQAACCPDDGKDSISLKVQTSNRKIVHTLRVSKYDKLSILMNNYAKLRSLPLEKLKFKFDGETLKPSDTPSDLDLEGGECIDAFEL